MCSTLILLFNGICVFFQVILNNGGLRTYSELLCLFKAVWHITQCSWRGCICWIPCDSDVYRTVLILELSKPYKVGHMTSFIFSLSEMMQKPYWHTFAHNTLFQKSISSTRAHDYCPKGLWLSASWVNHMKWYQVFLHTCERLYSSTVVDL